MIRIITRTGHYGVEPGRRGRTLFDSITFEGSEISWTPIVWDDSPDRPDWIPTESIEDEPEDPDV